MTIAAGDIVRCTLWYNLPDLQTNQNVCYYLAGAGVSDTDANVATALEAQMDTSYALLDTILDANIEPGEIKLSKYNAGTNKWESFATSVVTEPDGAGVGITMANTVAGVVRFFTDGLGQQGRKYISGIMQGNLTENTWTGPTITALLNYGQAYHDAVAVAGGNLLPGWWDVVNKAHRAYNTQVAVNAIAGTQVRRKPGRGSV